MVIFAGCNRQSRTISRMTNEPPPTSWDIYLGRHAAAKWIGTVEAADADAAIKEPAKKFNVQDIKKLIAVRGDSGTVPVETTHVRLAHAPIGGAASPSRPARGTHRTTATSPEARPPAGGAHRPQT